jgi:hypothetical protein
MLIELSSCATASFVESPMRSVSISVALVGRTFSFELRWIMVAICAIAEQEQRTRDVSESAMATLRVHHGTRADAWRRTLLCVDSCGVRVSAEAERPSHRPSTRQQSSPKKERRLLEAPRA